MSLVLAAGYVASLVGIYSVFVRLYRRQTAKAAREDATDAWFPENSQRDAYFAMLDGMPDDLTLDHVKKLKAALLRRAMKNVERIWSLREDRACLALLLKNGAIGDDLWNDFSSAEQTLNEEVLDCVQEAESLEKGWGQKLFPQAGEMAAREKQRQMEEERKKVEAQAAAMRERQEAERRAQAEKELLEEDEASNKSKPKRKNSNAKK
ncbi:Translocation protein S66 [Sorochytrium milnesiophthora]